MEKQEIYDKVCAHLAQQKTRAMMGDNCRFRGCNNTSCAIGCLIPDDLYRMDMEEGGTSDLFAFYPSVAELIGKENETLCRRLQSCHDRSRTADTLIAALQNAAGEFHLTPGAEQAITEWS